MHEENEYCTLNNKIVYPLYIDVNSIKTLYGFKIIIAMS